MSTTSSYILGQSSRAARRLEIQDAQFADMSERLLDELALQPKDRVVELGCGPGTFSHRILRRLGHGGVLVGVDTTEGLLTQARDRLSQAGAATFEPQHADITQLGPSLDGADVVVGRAVLHHVPMAELLLGRLRGRLRAGTRVGFIEPDFRSPLGRLAYLESSGRPELAPLRVWATVINQLYLAHRVSPDVGNSLARTLQVAGYGNVRTAWIEVPTDETTIENIVMFYDEVRDPLQQLGIQTAAETDEQQGLLRALPTGSLPAAWAIHRAAAIA